MAVFRGWPDNKKNILTQEFNLSLILILTTQKFQ